MAGIYLHIPFCERKCIYCDFYSETNHKDHSVFVKFLLKEIELYSDYHNLEEIQTIYFGGGTPSLLHPSQISEIINAIQKLFKVNQLAEITLEVNPGTVDLEKLKGIKAAGVNRLSIGVQSFNEDDLKFLSRIHSVADGMRCISDAKQAGFDNIGIDLIYALPTQTIESLLYNLQIAIDAKVNHISAYSLIVEEGTPLHQLVKNKKIQTVDEAVETQMMDLTIDELKSAGFEHYEISNFAKPGYFSKHNTNYWNHSNYLGFGPAAHSFWKNKRWWNIDTIFSYYSRLENNMLPISETENLNTEQLINEKFMLGLRSKGVDFRMLNKEFNYDYKLQFENLIHKLTSNQLASFENDHLQLTKSGIMIADEISRMFILRNSI